MNKKTFKLTIGNHRLLDANSSKELLKIINKPRKNGHVVKQVTMTGLVAERSEFDNISFIEFTVYGTTKENINIIIQEITNEIKELNPKLQPEF